MRSEGQPPRFGKERGNPAAAKYRCFQNPPDLPLGFTVLLCHAIPPSNSPYKIEK